MRKNGWLSDAVYRALLLALPAGLRRECGDDMAQLFRDYRRDAGGRPLRLASLWAAAVRDVAAQAASERAPRRPQSSLSMRSTMRALAADIRHGLRLLRRYPATSLLALVTLALGVGANTAMFSVVDAVLLRTLPYPNPDRLVMVWEKRQQEGVLDNVASPADYLDWRRLSTSFTSMAGYTKIDVSVTGGGDPVLIGAGLVSPAFFDVLDVRPPEGRSFRPEEETPGKNRVAILSHGLWQRRFGGAASIIGQTITINGNPWPIIGVLPASFQFIDEDVQLWLPLVLEGTGTPPTRVSHQLAVYARLKPDVSLARSRDEMDRLGRRLEEEHPQENKGHGAHVVAMQTQYVKDVKASLIVLFAAVGFVLLIACVNVANLLLSRAVSRGREMAVRSALGASRGRIIVQSLVESLTLAVAGGAVGLGVALLTLRALPLVMPARLSLIGLDEIGLDLRVLLFSLGLSVATGILFGVLPAIQASKPEIMNVLREGGRGAAGVRRRARLALVIGEVALAALTLMGAGLAVRSFTAMMSQPLGFDPHGRLSVTLSVPQVTYPSRDQKRAALADLERRLAAVPGVTSVGGINLLPLSGGDSRTGVGIEGREPTPDVPTRMHPRTISPAYFRTMAIPIVKGRDFTPEDDERATLVAIVNDTAARRFWPNDDAVGKRVRLGGEEDIWRTVVGISADVRHWGLSRPVNPMLYLPQAQAVSTWLTFVLRSDLDPASLTSGVRAQVAAFDKNIPVGGVRTLDDLVSTSVQSERAQTVLMGTFGTLALLLAVLGIYGVMAQLVTMRVHEIGVRMTLGARPIDVLRQLLVEGFGQTALGLVLGLGAGVYLMRFASALLVGIQPWDSLTLAGVSVVLMAAALVACLIPARRAMRVDPVHALRQS